MSQATELVEQTSQLSSDEWDAAAAAENLPRWLRQAVLLAAMSHYKEDTGHFTSDVIEGIEDVYGMFDSPDGHTEWCERVRSLLNVTERFDPLERRLLELVYRKKYNKDAISELLNMRIPAIEAKLAGIREGVLAWIKSEVNVDPAVEIGDKRQFGRELAVDGILGTVFKPTRKALTQHQAAQSDQTVSQPANSSPNSQPFRMLAMLAVILVVGVSVAVLTYYIRQLNSKPVASKVGDQEPQPGVTDEVKPDPGELSVISVTSEEVLANFSPGEQEHTVSVSSFPKGGVNLVIHTSGDSGRVEIDDNGKQSIEAEPPYSVAGDMHSLEYGGYFIWNVYPGPRLVTVTPVSSAGSPGKKAQRKFLFTQ